MALQSIWAALLNAVTLGIVFARISQPKQRARTIFMSDSAVISRRDGVLKFMFRIADIRNTQVTTLVLNIKLSSRESAGRISPTSNSMLIHVQHLHAVLLPLKARLQHQLLFS